MSNRWFGYVGLLAGTVLACAGCSLRHASVHFSDDRPRRVYHEEPVIVGHYDRPLTVVHTHVCDEHCLNHVWNGSNVVVLAGHRHGRDCGHHWNGKHWIAVQHRRGVTRLNRSGPRVVHAEHVHGPSCGHVWNQSRHSWVQVRRGHVHGPRCGHVYRGGRWQIRR